MCIRDRKKYAKAHKFLSRINFRHPKFQIQAGLLATLSSIEINQESKFQTTITKFQEIIDNLNGLSAEIVNQLSHFMEIARQFNQKNISKNTLAQALVNTPVFFYKDWFEEKLERL